MFEVSWRMDLSMKNGSILHIIPMILVIPIIHFILMIPMIPICQDSFCLDLLVRISFCQDSLFGLLLSCFFSVWIFVVWIRLVRIFLSRLFLFGFSGRIFFLLASDTKRCQGKAKLQRRRQGLRCTPVARCLA